jgi:tRNA(adenine34) deaminase
MTDAELMNLAIAEAQQAMAEGEVPIGCVIEHVPTGRIISRAHNRRHNDADATAHAEILAIRQACRELQSWRLLDCRLAITLEPCPKSAGAIVNARIPQLIYGCDYPKAGAVRTLFSICDDPRLNHRVEITAAVEAERCGALLKEFFAIQRAAGKK